MLAHHSLTTRNFLSLGSVTLCSQTEERIMGWTKAVYRWHFKWIYKPVWRLQWVLVYKSSLCDLSSTCQICVFLSWLMQIWENTDFRGFCYSLSLTCQYSDISRIQFIIIFTTCTVTLINNFLLWLVPASLDAVYFHNPKTWATRRTKQKKKWQEWYVKDLLALCLLMLKVEDYNKNELHPEHFRIL